MFNIPDQVKTALLLLVAIHEVAVRFYPTVKDLSLLSLGVKIITFLVPNIQKIKGTTASKGIERPSNTIVGSQFTFRGRN